METKLISPPTKIYVHNLPHNFAYKLRKVSDPLETTCAPTSPKFPSQAPWTYNIFYYRVYQVPLLLICYQEPELFVSQSAVFRDLGFLILWENGQAP